MSRQLTSDWRHIAIGDEELGPSERVLEPGRLLPMFLVPGGMQTVDTRSKLAVKIINCMSSNKRFIVVRSLRSGWFYDVQEESDMDLVSISLP